MKTRGLTMEEHTLKKWEQSLEYKIYLTLRDIWWSTFYSVFKLLFIF
jgi:hypothetical protein